MQEGAVDIRKIEKEDVDFVLDLGNSTEELWMDENIKFPFREKDLIKWSKSEDKFGYIVELGVERIDFLLVDIDDEMAEIIAFTIKEGYRNEGYGEYALEKVLDELEREGVTAQMTYAHKDNERAIEFYSKLGFEKGEEVVVMHRGFD